MATEVDIYNLALSHIGDGGNVAAVDEQSSQAIYCRRFYAMARDTALVSYPFSFALTRQALVGVTNDLDSWDYKYVQPNLVLKLITVLPDAASDDHSGADYMVENGYIYTNEQNADARYIFAQDDTGVFSQEFTNAVARLLASYIAGPIIKGKEGRREARDHFQLYLAELGMAKVTDANQSQDHKTYVPAGIAARGSGALEYLIQSPQDRP